MCFSISTLTPKILNTNMANVPIIVPMVPITHTPICFKVLIISPYLTFLIKLLLVSLSLKEMYLLRKIKAHVIIAPEPSEESLERMLKKGVKKYVGKQVTLSSFQGQHIKSDFRALQHVPLDPRFCCRALISHKYDP